MRKLLLLLVFLPLSVEMMAQKKGGRPNIIIILADDLGYGDISSFGAKDISTPNIDALGQNGIKFTSFYSTSPVCSPSRFGLLTGRFPRRQGIDHVFFPEGYTGIPSEEVTIAETLKGNGYRTGIVGKWHLGHQQKFLPLQNGFDEYYGIPYSNDMMGVVYLNGNEVDSLKVNQTYITKTYTTKAVSFIERHKNQPFFLYLAHNMPHVPIYASPAFEGSSKRGLYGDVIQELDWSVGEVVKALKKNGVAENTLVVFTSDNGPWLIFDIEGGSAGPLRNGKGTTFEGGQRVPTVAVWPGKIKPGTVYDNLATHLDWYPTIVALTGSQRSQTKKVLDGEDLSPVLFGTAQRKRNEFAYYSFGKIEAFRKGDWKLVLPKAAVVTGGEVITPATDTLLFNLASDVGEKENRSKAHPEKVKELGVALTAYRATIEENPPAMVQRIAADDSHIKKRQQRQQQSAETKK
jgi:arylsulfatase A